MEWHEIKNWLVEVTNLDRDALHVYAAVQIQLMAAWIFRRSIAHPLPWIAVLVVALLNEYYDYDFIRQDPVHREIFLSETVRDLWNTMLMPTILMAVAYFWPQRLSSNILNRTDEEIPDDQIPETTETR